MEVVVGADVRANSIPIVSPDAFVETRGSTTMASKFDALRLHL